MSYSFTVASLLVGDDGAFKGAARGASLFVGDVYGGNPAAGSASAIVRALGWAAGKRPRLINISLVGPANRAIERAVAALNARGITVVAAVGNDGRARFDHGIAAAHRASCGVDHDQ